MAYSNNSSAASSTPWITINNPDLKIRYVKADHQLKMRCDNVYIYQAIPISNQLAYEYQKNGYYYYNVSTYAVFSLYPDTFTYNDSGDQDARLNGVSFVF